MPRSRHLRAARERTRYKLCLWSEGCVVCKVFLRNHLRVERKLGHKGRDRCLYNCFFHRIGIRILILTPATRSRNSTHSLPFCPKKRAARHTTCTSQNHCIQQARADGAFLIIRAQGQRMGRIRRCIWMDRISVHYSYSLGKTIIIRTCLCPSALILERI